MSRARFMQNLRKQPWFVPVIRELEAAGVEHYEFAAPSGRGHPKLILRHGQCEARFAVPSTTGSESRYLLSRIRRFMEGAQEARGCARTGARHPKPASGAA